MDLSYIMGGLGKNADSLALIKKMDDFDFHIRLNYGLDTIRKYEVDWNGDGNPIKIMPVKDNPREGFSFEIMPRDSQEVNVYYISRGLYGKNPGEVRLRIKDQDYHLFFDRVPSRFS
jgi:hypothetical protein